MKTSPRAILLVNLGSPDSPSVPDVRRYLREFLLDPRVIEGSWLKRQLVVNLFILPFRPRNSAHAYASVWTKDGSPLLAISRKTRDQLQALMTEPVYLAMRYGNPSIRDVLKQILETNPDEILLMPLYPHYAMSSYETVVVRVQEVLAECRSTARLKILPPFFEDADYIESLYEASRPSLEKGYDHLLISFHGLPESHLKLADPSRAHCLQKENCCQEKHPAHEYCYRAQAFRTVEKFVKRAGIPREKYSISFQSRLLRDPWLKPYTDEVLVRLAKDGVRRLTIMAPAFVADCLETIEELGIRGRELFLSNGGREFELIPCMNDHPRWIQALQKMAQSWGAAPSPEKEKVLS